MADVTSPPAAARPPILFGAWLGVVLLFLFFGIFVFVLVAATPHGNNYEQKRAEAREKKLNDARNAATQELNSYAWVDKGKGVARIPINRAMELTVADLAQKKPAPAGPIATPAAQTAPAGAAPAPAARQGAAVSSSPAEAAAKAGPPSSGAAQPAQTAPAGALSAPPPGAAVASSPSSGAASASPATQPSPQAPTSPAPATTP